MNPGNLKGKGFSDRPENINRNGRPPGAKNRSTIVKKMLELNAIFPKKTFAKIKELYPELEQAMSAEEMMTIIQISNAITKGDTTAYKAVMDNAYQSAEIEASFAGFEINIKRKLPENGDEQD